jgi:hypothetical protein
LRTLRANIRVRPSLCTPRVQLADDPLVAPARILARQAKNQLTDLAADWGRPIRPVRPAARDETAVPTQQRRRRNEELIAKSTVAITDSSP